VLQLRDRDAELPAPSTPLLVHGNGRSYGDVCLNDGGTVLLGRGLDRYLDFDPERGILRAEAGVLLAEILELVVPLGWFLPVTPGTRYVTLGGALANDVHGKNHHRAGSFGHHVLAFELQRSDGSRRRCSPVEHTDWYAATIGGLGLTGLVTWVEIQLQRIPSAMLDVNRRRFTRVDDFFAMADEAEAREEFTVAWVDCAARGSALGRGVLAAASFASGAAARSAMPRPRRALRVPFTPPLPLINPLSLTLFNAAYYRQPIGDRREHYLPFFYPLDAIGEWNRIYGPRGFLQYQCVVPPAHALAATRELLERIAASGQGSFLAVLKRFGDRPSPGLLSFARPGTTIALDFPMRGEQTLRLLDSLDTVVAEAGGALYPAKDARMSAQMFQRGYPQLQRFLAYRDPAFSSGFWKRLFNGET
jgi:FAD/FMN-containing dehydrogenase